MHYKKVTIGKNLGFLFKCQLLYYMYIGYTVESFSFVGGGGGQCSWAAKRNFVSKFVGLFDNNRFNWNICTSLIQTIIN